MVNDVSFFHLNRVSLLKISINTQKLKKTLVKCHSYKRVSVV